MKADEREEGHEQEAFDGGGVVLQEIIGVPAPDQFIEAVIFGVPSPWSEGFRLRKAMDIFRILSWLRLVPPFRRPIGTS